MSGGIREAQALLASVLYHNPTFALAGAVAWLDPVRIADVGYDEDELVYALDVCNQIFPDIYKDAMLAIWSGKNYNDLDRLITGEVNKYLVWEMDDMYQMQYGLPYDGMGVDRYGYDGDTFEEAHPHLVPIMRVLGWTPEDHGGGGDDESEPYWGAAQVADHLAGDLRRYGEGGPHNDVRIMLRWLFNSTGAPLADYTSTYLAETDTRFDWTLEAIENVNQLHREALDVVHAAERGFELLDSDKAWRKAFQKNARKTLEDCIDRSTQKLTKGTRSRAKGKTTDKLLNLTWPGSDACSY